MTWENHINHLSASLTHSHNLIKMLTYGKTTLKLPLLVKIYNAMTRSQLDYGALALSSIPRSKLQKLEIKQNQILKTILGCFKSTPTALVCVETGISSTRDRWDLLDKKYLTKLCNKPWNAVYETIYTLTHPQPQWKPRSTPAAVRHQEALKESHRIYPKTLPSSQPNIDPIPPWGLFEIPSGSFPLNKHLATANPIRTSTLLQELTEHEQADHLSIFTDGSSCETTRTSTCACHIPKKK